MIRTWQIVMLVVIVIAAIALMYTNYLHGNGFDNSPAESDLNKSISACMAAGPELNLSCPSADALKDVEVRNDDRYTNEEMMGPHMAATQDLNHYQRELTTGAKLLSRRWKPQYHAEDTFDNDISIRELHDGIPTGSRTQKSVHEQNEENRFGNPSPNYDAISETNNETAAEYYDPELMQVSIRTRPMSMQTSDEVERVGAYNPLPGPMKW